MDFKHKFEGNINSQSGSSLIGVALLTLVLGFLMTGGIYLMQNYDTIRADQKSVDNSRSIEKALANFVAVNGRYPCPATYNAAPDTAGFGVENCAAVDSVTGRAGADVLIGAVPVRTINLPDKEILDGYNARYTYAITENHTLATANVGADLGAIFIRDAAGNSISENDGFVVYALMSHGLDGRGAFNLEGSEITPCDTTAGINAGENCDLDDAIFVTTAKAFNVGDDTFTHSFAFKANPVNYRWSATAWTGCAGICFEGTQTREVTCKDYRNDDVDPANCEEHTPVAEMLMASPPAGCTTGLRADTFIYDDCRSCELGPCIWRVDACSGPDFTGNVPTVTNFFNNNLGGEGFDGDGDGVAEANDGNDTDASFGAPHGPSVNGISGYNDSNGEGPGGSVLCGHFFNRGILAPNIYKGDLAFSSSVSNAAKRGYRLWAVPLTRHLNKNPGGVIEKMAQPFVTSWAQEMAYRSGYHNEGHWLGKVQLFLVKPVVGFIGLFVKDTNWSELKSEKSIMNQKNLETCQLNNTKKGQ